MSWCVRHREEIEKIPAEWREGLLWDFADEVVVPLRDLPGDATLIALLAEYRTFYQRRERIRMRRKSLRSAFPTATNDDRPIADTFELEYAARRDLLASIRVHLSKSEYSALLKSEFWSIQRELIESPR